MQRTRFLCLIAVLLPTSQGCTLPDVLYTALGDHYTATDYAGEDHYEREIQRARDSTSAGDRLTEHYVPWHDE